MLVERVRAGATVLMTTHILEVAERMADRIGVIAQGRLLAEGTLDELRRNARGRGSSLEDIFLDLVADREPGDREAGDHEAGDTDRLAGPDLAA